MSLAPLRLSSGERFRHVRAMHSMIKDREKIEALKLSDETRILRGLFYVHLYAALEYSVTNLIQETLRQIAALGPTLRALRIRFHAVSLNHLFQSLADGKGMRLKKRIELLDSQASGNVCLINDTIFADLLQSVKSDVLVDICTCMCVTVESLSDESLRRYVDETAERRHAVAHGRESAVEAGARITAAQLELRLNAVQQVVEALADALEALIGDQGFVREPEPV